MKNSYKRTHQQTFCCFLHFFLSLVPIFQVKTRNAAVSLRIQASSMIKFVRVILKIKKLILPEVNLI